MGRSGGLDFRLDYGWKHHAWHNSDNAPGRFERDASLQEAYGVANVSVSWTPTGQRWLLTAWCKNLTDTLYADQRTSFAGASWAHYAPPRTYGVSVQFRTQ